MKSLYEPATLEELKGRMAQLRPDSPRQWGKMGAAQMVAHCSGPMEWAVGDSRPPRMFLGRILGPLVKSKLLSDDQPMRKNAPTAKSLVVKDDRNLDEERKWLSALMDRFAAAGPQGCTTHPHPFFGTLTPEEWAGLMYKHLDHHFRQFGA